MKGVCAVELQDTFENIVRTAQDAIPVLDDDYEKDGIIYCGKCNTPKQTRITVFGKEMKPMCLCKCGKEKLKAKEEEDKRIQQSEELRRMRQVGFPDADMANWTFDRDDGKNTQLSTLARRYVQNFKTMRADHKGLLLFGNVGTGKTFASACIANALIDQGIPCLVTNFSRLVNEIQSMYDGKQEYIDNLSDFDLLVIDDLASERDTEYMNETVMNIIDSRYRSGLPLIVTTNLTADELKNPADVRKQRIYSRLFQMCIPYEVKGTDRRKEALKQDFNKYSELLGI